MSHVTSQEIFWVTDLGKVVSIKCQYEKSLAQLFILYDEKIVKIVRDLVAGG